MSSKCQINAGSKYHCNCTQNHHVDECLTDADDKVIESLEFPHALGGNLGSQEPNENPAAQLK